MSAFQAITLMDGVINVRATVLGGSAINADFYTRGSTKYFHFNFFEARQGIGNFNPKIDPTKFNLVDSVERNTVRSSDDKISCRQSSVQKE
ncbi:hypothetical protein E6C27_scaffold269G00700 [Cucumis melo var. makuwa]|uniref:Uncharacterized protein n=1 Tax=Cucumis melo var. makuwa TaxID=1194695 RepID=A0A5A7SRC7_CUCMM|nr:hypothetical protein E6C27_scaffold269G00700 [Cucumis melo var. makuwa]